MFLSLESISDFIIVGRSLSLGTGEDELNTSLVSTTADPLLEEEKHHFDGFSVRTHGKSLESYEIKMHEGNVAYIMLRSSRYAIGTLVSCLWKMYSM